MRKLLVALLCITMVFGLGACGGQKDAIDPDTVANCLIVLVTDKNMMGDGGLNDACWEGLKAAADEFADLSVEYVESKESYSESIEEAVDMDADLIICPNADMAEALCLEVWSPIC